MTDDHGGGMNSSITVERADNGWIVRHNPGFRIEVFQDLNMMLLAVYKAMDDWHIDDRIEIHRKQP